MECKKWFTFLVDTYWVMPFATLICGKGSGIILFFSSPAFGWASFVHFVPFVVI
jgi:hypothetical protein